MNQEDIISLQKALERLLHQIQNHQQSKTPIYEVKKLLSEASAKEDFEFKTKVLENLELLNSAICDPLGLGKLNLMLKNARVPKKYYDIFYEMLGGGIKFV
ncbi:hypothetical protein OQH60_05640 [Campylobacter sp. MIT 21-1685]|uniref:hypothetical protein n=1 Tax=unclassified Campylobacter TaxID=2593542 RepID=UPI00224A5149|nr:MULTISPECIES: hypothetical protein [unclassified Campylobacter]MCX2683315.1 hypothetical protein [Campylobacter sp. MIT 21-1684]MCX2807829.1 hypothetical protein [Campylobacter sp. MIT 21-1685]